jgi:hypothetical protein
VAKTDSKQYRVTGLGLDYPSIKDGKRRIRVTGDVVDDIPPNDISWLLQQEAIAEVDGSEPVTEDSEGGDAPEAGDG